MKAQSTRHAWSLGHERLVVPGTSPGLYKAQRHRSQSPELTATRNLRLLGGKPTSTRNVRRSSGPIHSSSLGEVAALGPRLENGTGLQEVEIRPSVFQGTWMWQGKYKIRYQRSGDSGVSTIIHIMHLIMT
ncbi:hypothetical protein DUNSADRAFT_9921 [Dunaliella salina]|uniref:Encoded protein n=1 Tax=Dunaliella salina TaxID=3046 RepID=A0ABQ7FSC6_DUNSA|nr:hypothetical protein DUNSADRAFT_9921 [Dunaliella salina]|eukprot:KAF5825442.1 hypothetical protein DUNSADRAFT_9921 [Dunaliella salina]